MTKKKAPAAQEAQVKADTRDEDAEWHRYASEHHIKDSNPALFAAAAAVAAARKKQPQPSTKAPKKK